MPCVNSDCPTIPRNPVTKEKTELDRGGRLPGQDGGDDRKQGRRQREVEHDDDGRLGPGQLLYRHRHRRRDPGGGHGSGRAAQAASHGASDLRAAAGRALVHRRLYHREGLCPGSAAVDARGLRSTASPARAMPRSTSARRWWSCGGKREKIAFFCLILPHSNIWFVKAYPTRVCRTSPSSLDSAGVEPRRATHISPTDISSRQQMTSRVCDGTRPPGLRGQAAGGRYAGVLMTRWGRVVSSGSSSNDTSHPGMDGGDFGERHRRGRRPGRAGPRPCVALGACGKSSLWPGNRPCFESASPGQAEPSPVLVSVGFRLRGCGILHCRFAGRHARRIVPLRLHLRGCAR